MEGADAVTAARPIRVTMQALFVQEKFAGYRDMQRAAVYGICSAPGQDETRSDVRFDGIEDGSRSRSAVGCIEGVDRGSRSPLSKAAALPPHSKKRRKL